MQKKILAATGVIGLVLFIIGLGTLQVSAQGPSNTYPGGAQYVDEQWRTIPPQSSMWFIFEYVGDRSEIQLTLVDGSVNNLRMNVFHPEQVRLPDTLNGDPIGRGSSTPPKTDNLTWAGRLYIAGTYYVQIFNPSSDTKYFQLKVAGSGTYVRLPTATITPTAAPSTTPTRTRTSTLSPNAVWTSMAVFAATMKAVPADGTPGTSTQSPGAETKTPTPSITTTNVAPGAQAITPTPTILPTPAITATTATTGVPTLTITPTVPVGTETLTATPVALVAPTSTPTPMPTRLPAAEYLDANNFYPQSAIYVLDGRERIIPGNSSLWFKFDYAGDGSLAQVRIPEGNLRKLAFRISTDEAINRLGLNATPIGSGTAPLMNDDGARVRSLDLTWSSKFIGALTVYVQVINDQPGQINFNLVVSGPGVILGRGQQAALNDKQ